MNEKEKPEPEKYFDFNKELINNKIYVYCRVSKDKQYINKQFEEIANYCINKCLYPPLKNIYFDNGISGGVSWLQRQTKIMYELIQKGGILIVPEITRLGRDCYEIMELISCLLRKNISIHDIKNEIIIDENKDINIVMKVSLLCVFGAMERNMIKVRTKSAMQTQSVKDNIEKSKLTKRNKDNKLDKHFELIQQKINDNINANQIAKELNVNKAQVYKFIRDKNIYSKKELIV